jgi:hypothetical protein
VLFSGKSLLLGRCDDLPVTQQSGGAVMIVGGYAENMGVAQRVPLYSYVRVDILSDKVMFSRWLL